MTNVMHDADPARLVARFAQLAAVRNSEDLGHAETRRRLNNHGIADDEIARQLATLKWNTAGDPTAAITTYSYLHGLQHLDAINRASVPLVSEAAPVLAIFRAAEMCLHTVGVLSARMCRALEAGDMAEALSCVRWRTGYQQVLYRLSLLLPEVNTSPVPGAVLSITDSRIHAGYRAHGAALHDWLRTHWPEDMGDVFGTDIHEPRRNVHFHEFVNTGDERVWTANFSRVRVPGVECPAGEPAAAFYARTVCTDEVERMLTAMETEASTHLLSFRVIHQVTETIANVVNAWMCEAGTLLVGGEDRSLHGARRRLLVGNRLLSVADECIRLMLRTLTPHAYSAIRPNLGMVRGTSSMVLRKTLFNGTYPTLVRALKLRLAGGDVDAAGDDACVEARARASLADPADPLGDVVQQLVVLHQQVRTWRDNHAQLPKTHLGVSPSDRPPTVSLSGSDSAVDIAHELRTVHARDPIVPLYRALMGVEPPPVHEMLSADGYDAHMAHATANEVLQVYQDVQERFYKRCPMHALGGTEGPAA